MNVPITTRRNEEGERSAFASPSKPHKSDFVPPTIKRPNFFLEQEEIGLNLPHQQSAA